MAGPSADPFSGCWRLYPDAAIFLQRRARIAFDDLGPIGRNQNPLALLWIEPYLKEKGRGSGRDYRRDDEVLPSNAIRQSGRYHV